MTPPQHPSTNGSFAAPAGIAHPTTRATESGAGTAGFGAASADVGGRFAEGLARVAALEHRPLAEHADAYQHLHADLQAVLADVDSA